MISSNPQIAIFVFPIWDEDNGIKKRRKTGSFFLARFETNKRQRQSLSDLSGGDGVYIIYPLIVKGTLWG